ncbi:hypothetical protein N8Z81_02800, partial [Akkermansiaceae bacterium]|nr:hypothetical protein [Akkermansiaceae bacterium]
AARGWNSQRSGAFKKVIRFIKFELRHTGEANSLYHPAPTAIRKDDARGRIIRRRKRSLFARSAHTTREMIETKITTVARNIVARSA